MQFWKTKKGRVCVCVYALLYARVDYTDCVISTLKLFMKSIAYFKDVKKNQ